MEIDQQAPAYQFGSYVFNQYQRSTNNGASWSSVNLNASTGQFINPIDYDNTVKIMYCGDDAGAYRRWTDPQTGSTSDVVTTTALNSSSVYAITVCPYTANRVYFGTAAGRVVRVDAANTVASPAAGTLLGTLTANISNISFGQSEDTIIVTASSYSGTQVYYTTNGTSATPTWVSKDGNLPDMPVRWSLPVPGSAGKRVLLATETGVWYTTDITAATVTWLPDPTFPTVRTDMLKLRASDNTVAAATHGRGMWSANIGSVFAVALPINECTLRGNADDGSIMLNWTCQTVRTLVKFDVEHSENAADFITSGTVAAVAGKNNYTFNEDRPSAGRLYYRIKIYDAYGLITYSNIATFAPGGLAAFDISKIYPNPAHDQLFIAIHVPVTTKVRLQVYSATGSKVLDNGEQSLSAGSQVLSLGIAALQPGNYVLSAIVDGKHYSYKFVKQ